jgi:hypothetical protein
MAKKFYLQSTTSPAIRFQIMARDKTTNVMKLKGAWSEFEEVMTKEKMDQYKYKIVIEETEDGK